MVVRVATLSILAFIFSGSLHAQSFRERLEYEGNVTEWLESTKLGIANWGDTPKPRKQCLNFREMKVGHKGYLEWYQYVVTSVVGPKDVLVHLPDSDDVPPLWVSGFPTDGLVDKQLVRIAGEISVTGTKSYETAGGSKRTVLRVEFVKPKEVDPFREWKSADGKFTTEAKFVGYKRGVVTLEKKDGSKIEVKPSQLSQADQKFYRDLLRLQRKNAGGK